MVGDYMLEFVLGFLVGVLFSWVIFRLIVRIFAAQIGMSDTWVFDEARRAFFPRDGD